MEGNRCEYGEKMEENSKRLAPNGKEGEIVSRMESEDPSTLLTTGSTFFLNSENAESLAETTLPRPITPERKKRPKDKGVVGSLRMTIEKKVETVERLLEDRVERILEEKVDKHPWLQPIETWIADRSKSSSTASNVLLENRKRKSFDKKAISERDGTESHDSDAPREVGERLKDLEDKSKAEGQPIENAEERLSCDQNCLKESDDRLTNVRKISCDEEQSGTNSFGKTEEKLRDMQRLIREVGLIVDRQAICSDAEQRTHRTEVKLQIIGEEQIGAEVIRETEQKSAGELENAQRQPENRETREDEDVTFDFKFTNSSKDDEEPRLESRVIDHLRNLRKNSPGKADRSGFDPAMFISRIRERRENWRNGREVDEQSVDGTPGILDLKDVRHHNHDLLDKLKDNVKGKMEDIHRYFQRTNRLADVNRKLKSQIWSSVVTIVLVEAKNLLPMDIDGLSDPYVKFRLGTEKYKSKVANKTLNPVWLEQFDLHLYEDPYLGQELEVTVWDRDKSHQDDLMGRAVIDLATLERETTHRLWRDLEDGSGNIFLLLTISGTTASETISDLAAHEETPRERVQLMQRYCIVNTLQRPRDVGHLTVKVYRAQGLAAADLGGKSDPFCVLELVNSRLQTQTEYKTLAPNWQKIFTFNVKDINSVLEVTVYDEDRDHKVEFLGKVAIPLLRIRNGEKRWYALKDKKLRGRAKGNSPQILLELTVIWNVFRACIRTLNPKEKKYMEPEIKFKRQVFLRNVLRLKAIIIIFIDLGKYIQSCFEWESKMRSAIALVLFILGCYYFEPYMIPALALLILLKYYLVAVVTGAPITNMSSHIADSSDMGADDCPPTPGDDDDDEDDKDKEEKKSLKERLQVIQEVTQTVQNSIGYIASLCERVKNLFNFTVPYLSYLAMLLTILGAFVLYFVPIRYLILAWGVNKFSRKLVRPHSVPNNEILDLISRVPDDEEILNYRELKPLPTADCEKGGGQAGASGANTRREQRKRQKASA